MFIDIVILFLTVFDYRQVKTSIACTLLHTDLEDGRANQSHKVRALKYILNMKNLVTRCHFVNGGTHNSHKAREPLCFFTFVCKLLFEFV